MHHGKSVTTLSLLFIMKWFWWLSLVLWLMTDIVKKLLVHLQKHWTINWHTQTYLYNVHGNAETHTNSTYITAIINRKMFRITVLSTYKEDWFPPSVYLCTRHSKNCNLISIISGLSIHISSWEWAFFGRFLG